MTGRAHGADRALAAAGAAAGGLGVALSAVAAHRAGAANLDTAARFLLLHGVAVMAVSALAAAGVVRPTLGRLSGAVLLSGTALFCGDLAARTFAGAGLFPMAAPLGGTGLIAGWALAALAALAGPARPR